MALFPHGDVKAAFCNLMDRLGVGEYAPPGYSFTAAARNSDDPKWSGSFLAAEDPEE